VQALSGISCLLLALSFAGGLASCRALPKLGREKGAEEAAAVKPEAPAPAATLLPTGTVELVDEAGGFVLIRSGRGLQLEPGTMLTIHGDQGEAVATVSVSPARKGPFLTADIVAGSPRKGQRATMAYSPETGRPTPFPSGYEDPNAIQVLE
jgi:hypothetical protein